MGIAVRRAFRTTMAPNVGMTGQTSHLVIFPVRHPTWERLLSGGSEGNGGRVAFKEWDFL